MHKFSCSCTSFRQAVLQLPCRFWKFSLPVHKNSGFNERKGHRHGLPSRLDLKSGRTKVLPGKSSEKASIWGAFSFAGTRLASLCRACTSFGRISLVSCNSGLIDGRPARVGARSDRIRGLLQFAGHSAKLACGPNFPALSCNWPDRRPAARLDKELNRSPGT